MHSTFQIIRLLLCRLDPSALTVEGHALQLSDCNTGPWYPNLAQVKVKLLYSKIIQHAVLTVSRTISPLVTMSTHNVNKENMVYRTPVRSKLDRNPSDDTKTTPVTRIPLGGKDTNIHRLKEHQPLRTTKPTRIAHKESSSPRAARLSFSPGSSRNSHSSVSRKLSLYSKPDEASENLDYSNVPVESIPECSKPPIPDIPVYHVEIDHEKLARDCRIAQFSPSDNDESRDDDVESVFKDLEPLELVFDNKENKPPVSHVLARAAENTKKRDSTPLSVAKPLHEIYKINNAVSSSQTLPKYMQTTASADAKRVTIRRRRRNIGISKPLAAFKRSRALAQLPNTRVLHETESTSTSPSLRASHVTPRDTTPLKSSKTTTPAEPACQDVKPELDSDSESILDILDASLTADLDY